MKGFDIILGAMVVTVLGLCFYGIFMLLNFTANYFEVSGWVVFGAFCVINMLFGGPVFHRTVTVIK